MTLRLLFILMLGPMQTFSQCLTSEGLTSKITDIEGSAIINNKKIAVLRSLADAHLKCTGKKDSLYARAMHRIGDLYRLEGNFDNAFAFTYAAIAINRSHNAGTQPSYLANSYYNLGIYYNLLSRFNASMRSFDSCIYFGSLYPDKHTIALMAYEQKSFLYFERGDYQESITIANEGISFARKNNDTFYEGVLVTQKAQAQLFMNNVSSAETNVKEAIKRLMNDPGEYLATAYSVYAVLLREKRDYSSAKNYYTKAFELNRQFNNWVQCGRDLSDLGYLYDYYMQDSKKALAEYNRAMKYVTRAGDKSMEAALFTNIGLLYWREKNYRESLVQYQHALNTLPVEFDNADWITNPSFEKLQAISNDYYLATLLFNKAQSLLDLSKHEKNTELLNASLNTFVLADRVMTKMRWKQLYDESKLFWRQETKDMYERAIEACYLSHNTDKAFYFFEKSRAVLLKDKLLKLSYDSVIGLKQAQRQLNNAQQSLVEYFTGDSVLYILSIGPDNKFLKVPRTAVKENAARMMSLCSHPASGNQHFDEFRVIARELYDRLFAPLQLKTERIVISPDEEFIPFEALVTDNGFMLKKHAISYTYSAELLFRKKNVIAQSKSFLGIAPVSYNKRLKQPALNGSDKSLAAISKYFTRPEILTNEAATRSAFFKNLPQHRIVQLYSHGYAEETDPVLYFNDSVVQLSEIRKIKNIETEMIALSACQTGTGKVARGEGIFSFARGFYAAGIPSLLTTLWQVDDRATYGITELFYKHLQKGLNKDEALRRAKLDFISGNDKLYQLPYYWSSYILIGNADHILSEPGGKSILYIIATIVFATMLIYLFARKLRR